MRKMKYVIGVLLFLMLIGYATISVSLSLGGKANVLSDLDDFKVYFSNVLVNNEQDLSLVKSDKELEFSFDLREIGSTYSIRYDVTNASSVFDASLSINCTDGDDLLLVENEFDTSTLVAKSTRTGTLTLKKLRPNLNPDTTTYSVSCTINATAISRDSNATGTIPVPLQPISIETGDVISIAGENFNVISQTDDTVTMLAQYNLDTDFRQDSYSYHGNGNYEFVSLIDPGGWGQPSVPTEIDIHIYSNKAANYVDNYVEFLNESMNVSSVVGNLITLKELKTLGCVIDDNYMSSTMTCIGSEYSDWLINNQYWVTRSADCQYSNDYFAVFYDGNIESSDVSGRGGIRPVITIPIDLAKKYLLKDYTVGDFVILGDEKFNVIRDNGTTVSLLAQKNLGTNYRQNDSYIHLEFSDSSGWSADTDVDVQLYDGKVKTYVNQYLSYLKSFVGDSSLSTDLITTSELKNLGCRFFESAVDGNIYGDCLESPNLSWLNNGVDWWTRTASGVSTLYVVSDEYIELQSYNDDAGESFGVYGVRPVVTVSKSFINMEKIMFKIDGEMQWAYKGMTLKDWVNSSYNIDGYYYSSSGYLYNSSGTEKNSIDSSTLITNDLNIILSNNSMDSGGTVN